MTDVWSDADRFPCSVCGRSAERCTGHPRRLFTRERIIREVAVDEEIEVLARELCDTYYLTVDPDRQMSDAYDKITEATRVHWRAQARLMRSRYETCAEKVLALWNRGGGWIPGAAHAELAEALGIDGSETLKARQSRQPYTEPPGSY
jgi:hypothetical protein